MESILLPPRPDSKIPKRDNFRNFLQFSEKMHCLLVKFSTKLLDLHDQEVSIEPAEAKEDSVYFDTSSSDPLLFDQNKCNELVRNLPLSKYSSEILAPRLKLINPS